jgi:uncharacterized protein YjbI with pentapeptide repeats
MALKPIIQTDEFYQLLREGKIKEFNFRKGQAGRVKLTDCDFRHLDLRGLDAQAVDFRNSYFHQSDLRGVDLSQASLDGASFNGARISGVLFPRELSADEIMLSVTHGTRVRYVK